MRVDDHDLSHLEAVDETPVENVPGAIKKSIRDSGTYEAEEFTDEMVIATFNGRRLKERYAIFRAGESWLVHKMKPGG